MAPSHVSTTRELLLYLAKIAAVKTRAEEQQPWGYAAKVRKEQAVLSECLRSFFSGRSVTAAHTPTPNPPPAIARMQSADKRIQASEGT